MSKKHTLIEKYERAILYYSHKIAWWAFQNLEIKTKAKSDLQLVLDASFILLVYVGLFFAEFQFWRYFFLGNEVSLSVGIFFLCFVVLSILNLIITASVCWGVNKLFGKFDK